jgi:hypothetical protein
MEEKNKLLTEIRDLLKRGHDQDQKEVKSAPIKKPPGKPFIDENSGYRSTW